MTWQNFPPFSLAQAVALGHDLYEVLITNWGVVGAAGPNQYVNVLWPPPINGVVQPGAEISLAGIAIGPKSTADRCLVTYNLQSPKTLPEEGPDPTDRVRRCTVDSPLYFTQASNPGARPDPTQAVISNQVKFQSLNIWAGQVGGPFSDGGNAYSETQTYLTANGATDPFVSAGIGDSGTPPVLHLYLYLKPIATAPPASRAPLFQLSNPSGFVLQTANVEKLMHIVPISGRRTVSVSMRMNVTASFRIGSLNINSFYERPEAVTAVIPASKTVNFKLAGLNADFLLLYITPTVNSAGFEPKGQISVAAYDHGGGGNSTIIQP